MNEHRKRAKAMCRTIRISWSSLKSHLQWSIDADPGDTNADECFHSKAIYEYAQQIYICARELKHLNLERKKNGETARTKEKSIQKQDSRRTWTPEA